MNVPLEARWYAAARVNYFAIYCTSFMTTYSLFTGAGVIVAAAWALAFVLLTWVVHPVLKRKWSEAWDARAEVERVANLERMTAYLQARGW